MKTLVSFFLTMLTITSVLAGADTICFDQDEIAGDQVVSNSFVDNEPSQKPVSAPLHQEGSNCHTCHLGHCAFVVVSDSYDLVIPANEMVPPEYLASVPSDHSSSLFRPPIA